MQEVQAVFIDCDGVLYDVHLLTYEEILAACQTARQKLGLNWDDFDKIREKERQKGFHGVYNVILQMCQAQKIPFETVAKEIVKVLDYSRIGENPKLLDLIHKVAQKRKVYIFTNNTYAHLNEIFMRLFHTDVLGTKLNFITIEDTLLNGRFYTKKMPGVLTDWCHKIGSKPQNTLIMDDTLDIIQAAQEQGLKYAHIQNAQMTQDILEQLI